ncbi:MAG: pyridoxamine 5'-phosphate oxidase family protein [Actinomycetota bacterium]|nr:pyridoxamine 5'-phosphate oxidase family protein [Actinomycetota bacterium]
MTATKRADKFAAALQRFEESGDSTDLCGQFAEAAGLGRPVVDQSDPHHSDVRKFWETYRSQFSHISTEFPTVDEAGDLAVLEWSSKGELATGRCIDYRGVSLLTFDETDLRSTWPSRSWRGPSTPGLTLIKVHADSAEFWESPSSKMVRLFGAARAAATGDKEKFPNKNETVDL